MLVQRIKNEYRILLSKKSKRNIVSITPPASTKIKMTSKKHHIVKNSGLKSELQSEMKHSMNINDK
jgi:hypothetical protein